MGCYVKHTNTPKVVCSTHNPRLQKSPIVTTTFVKFDDCQSLSRPVLPFLPACRILDARRMNLGPLMLSAGALWLPRTMHEDVPARGTYPLVVVTLVDA